MLPIARQRNVPCRVSDTAVYQPQHTQHCLRMAALGTLFAFAILTVAKDARAGFIDFATDTLAWSEGEIVATAAWADAGTVFTYDVDQGTGADAGLWKYTYTFSVPSKSPSHLNIEASASFEWGNIIDPDPVPSCAADGGWCLQVHAGDGTDTQPNPYQPEDMYGIKFDSPEDTMIDVRWFISDREPMWGDFFAKDGAHNTNGSKVSVAAYNAGFGAPDTDPAIDLDNFSLVRDHILVPDTNGGGTPPEQVPEPGVLALFGTGLLILGIAWRRRRVEQTVHVAGRSLP